MQRREPHDAICLILKALPNGAELSRMQLWTVTGCAINTLLRNLARLERHGLITKRWRKREENKGAAQFFYSRSDS